MKPIVVKSLESDNGLHCIDVLRSEDEHFFFIEYRRDLEDASGWYQCGPKMSLSSDNESAAVIEACDLVSWIKLSH